MLGKQILRLVIKHQYLLLATGIVVMLALIFSHNLPSDGEDDPVVATFTVPSQPGELYLLSLGTFETGTDVLAAEGALRLLDLPLGLVSVDGGYHLFTQIVAQPEEARGAMGKLEQGGIGHQLLILEPSTSGGMAWEHFYQAANQQHFTVEEEFMDQFGSNDMEIWGYFVTLSQGKADFSEMARQQMLLEIFEWLTMKQGDIIDSEED
ncbi:MAG: hypothetical protein FWF59_13070 [Turicibacter sp.]|nr:hypothetical protein [Turicibacter sp.]